jgi:hypothetical protein
MKPTKQFVVIASAMSLLTISTIGPAEERLSPPQLDGITAGAFEGYAGAEACGVTASTYTLAVGSTYTVDAGQVDGQVGAIDVVRSDSRAQSPGSAAGAGLTDAMGYAQSNAARASVSAASGMSYGAAGAARPDRQLSIR